MTERRKKIILTQGIQASGKTTWAKDFVNSNASWARVNKDDIRAMKGIDYKNWFDKKIEQRVIDVERAIVEILMNFGMNIIVDNTHLIHKRTLQNKHINFYRELAALHGYEFEIKKFIISKEEAIERDSKRDESEKVWAEVIERTLKYSLLPDEMGANPCLLPENTSLPKAVLCDIDWTLAFMNGKRSPYDYSKVGGDDLNFRLKEILKLMSDGGVRIIYVSGRSSICVRETLGWLGSNGLAFRGSELHMRDDKVDVEANGNKSSDVKVKKRIYDEEIKWEYDVIGVFDDRDQVVKLWRSEGLLCLQAYYGDF